MAGVITHEDISLSILRVYARPDIEEGNNPRRMSIRKLFSGTRQFARSLLRRQLR